jgi:hypothetical protein
MSTAILHANELGMFYRLAPPGEIICVWESPRLKAIVRLVLASSRRDRCRSPWRKR